MSRFQTTVFRFAIVAFVTMSLFVAERAAAMILVKIDSVRGDVYIEGHVGDLEALDARIETAGPGKSGGVLTLTFESSDAVKELVERGLGGEEFTTIEVAIVEEKARAPITYLRYKLDRCFVKSWSTSGDADDRPTEEVAFYYNRIAFGY